MKDSKDIKFSSLFQNRKFQKTGVAILTYIFIFIICLVCIIPKKYNLKAGDIAPADIKAPRDFIDEESTKNKMDKAIANVQPQYNKNADISKDALSKLSDLLNDVQPIKASTSDSKEQVSKLKTKVSGYMKMTDDDYTLLFTISVDEIKSLSNFMNSTLTKIYAGDIKEDNVDDLKKAQDDLNFYIRNSNLSRHLKDLASNIGISLIRPNVFYDSDRTESLKAMVKKQVEPVIVKKSQNIVLKGEVITDKHIYLMKEAGLLQQGKLNDVTIYVGLGILIAVVELLFGYFAFRYRKNIYDSVANLSIIAILVCVNAGASTLLKNISVYMLPAAGVTILICMMFDSLTAFAVNTICTIIIACVTNFNVNVVVYYLASGMAGIMLSYNNSQRSNIIKEGIYISIINFIMVFSICFINNVSIEQNIINSLCAFGGGIASAVLAIGSLPLFEQIFNIITPIRLMELSNPNQPLLKKLLFEAPGTYHHSILVGNLAETAADEIGANSLLARVGAYYHDIGKTKRPYFFKENQITNDNPHDKITPKLSTLIITSHVKDGLELGKKYRLPKDIMDIIAQHHGTTLVKYFYVVAVNNSKEDVEEKTFRYEGPKPSSKESAIVMLADSTEAAVRSLKNQNLDDIQKMVDKVVKGKIDDGQLDNCNITFNDINIIKKSFLKSFSGMAHKRIEYPEIKGETI